MTRKLTRRHVLAAVAATTTTSFVSVARGAPAEAQKITPELIEAAKKEGKASWYTSVDLPVAEKVAKAFEAGLSRHQHEGRALGRRAQSSSASARSTRARSTIATS